MAVAFSEYYIDPLNGDNKNGGSSAGSPVLSDAGGVWVNATLIFTVSSGNTSAVSVGMAMSINDGAYIAKVTAKTTSTITLDSGAIHGTNPSNGTYTGRVGGAWKGPSGTTTFPFATFNSDNATVSGNNPRINVKNNATMAMTANIPLSTSLNTTKIQGYVTTVGDKAGKALIDGGTSGTPFNLITVPAGMQGVTIADMEFAHNGDSGSGSADGITGTANTAITWMRCYFHNFAGTGYAAIGSGSGCQLFIDCQSAFNSADGWKVQNGASVFVRCRSNGNGASGWDILAGGAVTFILSNADKNLTYGWKVAAANITPIYWQCVAYKNTLAAGFLGNRSFNVSFSLASGCYAFKNGGPGFDQDPVATLRLGLIENTTFGTGTMANGGGTIANAGNIEEVNSTLFTTDSTPFNDPENGDFSLKVAATATFDIFGGGVIHE